MEGCEMVVAMPGNVDELTGNNFFSLQAAARSRVAGAQFVRGGDNLISAVTTAEPLDMLGGCLPNTGNHGEAIKPFTRDIDESGHGRSSLQVARSSDGSALPGWPVAHYSRGSVNVR
jgi:hypothetical protein